LPLIFQEKFSEFEIAVWRINEDENFFRLQLQLSEEEKIFLQNIKAPNKRLEWLASRHLIRSLLKTDLFIDSNFKQKGKPELLSHKKEISISHSSGVCAVIVSEKKAGVDIELLGRNVSSMAHKFISDEEKKNRELTGDELLFIWCVKECLFKLYAKGGVDFQRDLFAELPIEKSGISKAEIRKTDFSKTLTIYHRIIENNFLLCWTVDN